MSSRPTSHSLERPALKRHRWLTVVCTSQCCQMVVTQNCWMCFKKLLDSAKNLVTSFQLKSAWLWNSAKTNYFLRWVKSTQSYIINLSSCTFTAQGQKMFVLATTFFGPQIFRRRFEQRKCNLLPFCITQLQFLKISLKLSHVFIQQNYA